METPAETTYRFGPFEVNPASGELLKQGKRIKLQEQPFRLLVILLENAGEVVSRPEIQSRIWEKNTFVDFDSSLRVAVGKLREALADDAENPHYIETIPKRGYRFIGPAIRPADSVNRTHVSEMDPVGKSPAGSTRSNQWVFVVRILLLAAVVAGALLFFFHGTRVLTEKDTVVLADFVNSTGDPVFDGTLRQGMTVQLEQSPFLGLVSDQRIQRTLPLMGQPADAKLTPEIAREVCERTGSAAVLDGSITSLGTHYVLGLRATNCRTGDLLDQEQAQAEKKEDVLNALDQIASRFRTRVGESLTTVEQHDMPLAEATTPSLEALKAYSTGWKVIPSEGEAAALPFFKHAVELDPKFAMAYATLGLMYGATGESALAAENIGKAYELRDRASDKEKFFITAYYDGRATGNQEKAQQTCEAWAKTYPREFLPHSFLSGFIYTVLGKHENAVEEAQKTIDLAPDAGIGYLNLGYDNLYLDHFPEAEEALRRASARKVEISYFSVLRYDIAFLKGDPAGMDREVASAQKNPEAEDWISQHQAFVLAYTGRLQAARRMSQRAATLTQQASHRERAALFATPPALWQAFFGNATAARQSAMAALELANDREVEYGAALALALAGDSVRAETLANDLEKRFPEDTSVKFSYLPALRGVLALNQGDPSKAIELLQISAPYELDTPRSNLQGFFGALYPIYVRGDAYLALHRGADAAAEFQKILDHRGTVISDPIGALARLQLARAYAMQGDTTKAKAIYQDFLTLWKDADSDLPVFAQAKAEFSELH